MRQGHLPPGTHPGLLFALANLVRAGRRGGPYSGSRRPHAKDGAVHLQRRVYDLTVSSWERVKRAQYGARTYQKLVRLEFESRNREKGNTERFVFACGTEGDLTEVPVFVRYQPKWWFKVEGVLD